MGRPKASQANLRVAEAFANAITRPIVADISGVNKEDSNWFSNVSACTLFAVIEKSIPSIMRDSRDRYPVNRDGVTSAEFRKHLIRLGGYVARRYRRRRSESAKGVKNVVWSHRRWIDCNNTADLLHLKARIAELLASFPKLGGNLDPGNIARTITTTVLQDEIRHSSAGPFLEEEEPDSDSSIDDESRRNDVMRPRETGKEKFQCENCLGMNSRSSTAMSLDSLLSSNSSVLCTARQFAGLSPCAPLASRCYLRLADYRGGTATGWSAVGLGGPQWHGLETCPAGSPKWAAFVANVHYELGIKVCAANIM